MLTWLLLHLTNMRASKFLSLILHRSERKTLLAIENSLSAGADEAG
jgi:hypothetical protein